MKIRSRAYLLGMLPALLVAVLLAGYLGLSRIADLENTLRERGDALARHVAQGAEYAVQSGNHAPLNSLLKGALRERDVIHVGVYQPDGERIAEAGRAPEALSAPLTAGMADTGKMIVFTAPVELDALDLVDPFFQTPAPEPPQASRRTIAWVQVVFSRAGNAAIARYQLLTTLGLVAMGMLVTVMLVRTLALTGIRPLMEIIAAVRDITAHKFRVHLPPTANSELLELQHGINQMSEVLQSFEEDMQGRVDVATAELAKEKETAERANHAKSRFLAAASHDLRQPMHAISLYVASMKPQVAGREAAVTLGKIETAVAAMESLFCGILDISKLDAGAVVPEISSVSVKSLLEGLHAEFQKEAGAKGLRLRLHHCQAHVASDAVLLGRILRNLISNALRYTDHGGVLITARRHLAAIRFQVWDTGQGIQPEHLEHIFHEYFQAANPQRDRAQGLGLGLAIVDRLSRLLGHPLTLRSRPGKGSVFSLDVPLSQAEPARADATGNTLEALARLHGNVAIVDDDAMVLDSLKTLLEGWGLDVIQAARSTDLLKQLERAPDLLITDYRLGAEDGLELARILCDAFPEAVIPAIVMTGDVGEAGQRALKASAYPILHKPVRPARLRALVTQLLRSSREKIRAAD
jgi:signal transduction histidine kinase/ActR/RegA family two-component response regulator